MDKFAKLVRDSEVRGAMAAFVDLGMVKVASQEEFDGLVDAVCQGIGDEDYDLQKVASLTEEVLSTPKAEEQEKTALLGTVIGAARAGNLSDEERAALIKHYGLSSNASLGWRNAGRGFLGGNVGGLIGGGLGAATGSPVLALLGQAAGAATGSKFMTDKYSKGNAEKIMKQRAKTAADTDDIARKAALGELFQMKVAGQLDEASFIEAASSLFEKEATEAPAVPDKEAAEAPAAMNKEAAGNMPERKVLDAEVIGGKKNLWKRVAKGGAAAAGVVGGAALAKSLYDKYTERNKKTK